MRVIRSYREGAGNFLGERFPASNKSRVYKILFDDSGDDGHWEVNQLTRRAEGLGLPQRRRHDQTFTSEAAT